MSKISIFCFLYLLLASVEFPLLAHAQKGTNQVIIKETNELKKLNTKHQENEVQEEAFGDDGDLQEDEEEDRENQTIFLENIKKVDFNAAIEFEAFYEKTDSGGTKEEASELTLSSAEFIVEAEVNNCLRTYVQVEDEDEEGVVVSEAIIHFQAEDVCEPDLSCDSFWYTSIGKMDIPFGYFESHLISDVVTLELGETKGKAVIIGAYNTFMNVFTGIYDGEMVKTGSGDRIENYFAAIYLTLPHTEDNNLDLVYGVSYISNIADSDELIEFINDEFDTETVENYVPGASVSLSASLDEQYYLETEYVIALEEFKEDKLFEPKAWNIEFAFCPTDEIKFTLGYSGSKDALDFLPETHVGIACGYDIFDDVSIGIECFQDKFENYDETIGVISQFRVEF
jgi:hypothetical protein